MSGDTLCVSEVSGPLSDLLLNQGSDGHAAAESQRPLGCGNGCPLGRTQRVAGADEVHVVDFDVGCAGGRATNVVTTSRTLRY